MIGQGKIGLPISVAILGNNISNHVVGIDANEELIDELTRGSYSHVIENDFDWRFDESVRANRLSFSLDYSSVSKAQVILVAVPLKIDSHGKPDFQNLKRAFQGIARNIQVGSLVILETTIPVGICRGLLIPIIESASGLYVGRDFYFAFSPERVSSGRFFEDLYKYPKLIGPFDFESGELARDFYSTFLPSQGKAGILPEIRILTSIETAEFVKLAESIYRDVNIGLANLFSNDCIEVGVDYFEVQENANSQSFSHLHSPGIYVGGHCIPVYPHLYESSFPTNPFLGLIKNARLINNLTHQSLIDLVLEESTNRGTKVKKCLILGASYRGNIKEVFDSGVFQLRTYLEDKGVECLVYDPLYKSHELVNLDLKPTETTNCESQLVVINSDHNEFLDLDSDDLFKDALVLDGRNILTPSNFRPNQLFTIGIGWNG